MTYITSAVYIIDNFIFYRFQFNYLSSLLGLETESLEGHRGSDSISELLGHVSEDDSVMRSLRSGEARHDGGQIESENGRIFRTEVGIREVDVELVRLEVLDGAREIGRVSTGLGEVAAMVRILVRIGTVVSIFF